jgi:flagellar motility protein MotE (MotC chaperone)
MKKLIVMGVVVAVLFGLSAAASWVLRQGQAAHAEHDDAEPAAETKKAGGHGAAPGAGGTAAVKPPFNSEADAAANIASSFRNQQEALKGREAQLTGRMKQLETILLDIRTERATMEELRKQINEEMKALAEKLDNLERKSGDVDKQRDKLSKQRKELDASIWSVEANEKESVKRLAGVYDTMDAEAAARHLQLLADTGKMDLAVKILSAMRDRTAARVLSEMPDSVTVGQLVDRMRAMDRGVGGKTGAEPTPR